MDAIKNLIEKIEEQDLWQAELLLNRKEYLKVKGSPVTNIYYVETGSLRIYLLNEYEEHPIRFGYHNNLIACLDSFISEKPSELYIQAIKKNTIKGH